MKFKNHAFIRLQERSLIKDTKYIIDLYENNKIVPVGKDGKKIHYLFYSEIDNNYFVLVYDELTDEVITFLYPDYHNKWNISDDAFDIARELILGKSEVLIEDNNEQVIKKRKNKRTELYTIEELLDTPIECRPNIRIRIFKNDKHSDKIFQHNMKLEDNLISYNIIGNLNNKELCEKLLELDLYRNYVINVKINNFYTKTIKIQEFLELNDIEGAELKIGEKNIHFVLLDEFGKQIKELLQVKYYEDRFDLENMRILDNSIIKLLEEKLSDFDLERKMLKIYCNFMDSERLICLS